MAEQKLVPRKSVAKRDLPLCPSIDGRKREVVKEDGHRELIAVTAKVESKRVTRKKRKDADDEGEGLNGWKDAEATDGCSAQTPSRNLANCNLGLFPPPESRD
jgi:hypothetical protein